MNEIQRVRLIAVDFDGTLLDRDSKVPPALLPTIRRAEERGVTFVAATGRRLSSARPHLDVLGWKGWAVVSNGATVVATPEGPTHWSRYLEPGFCRLAVDHMLRHELGPIVYCDTEAGPGEILIQSGSPDPLSYIARYTKVITGSFTILEDLREKAYSHVLRMACAGPLDELENLEARLSEFDHDVVNYLHVHDPMFDTPRLEIIHHEVNKWRGVQVVADELGIAISEIAAIGDDRNDVEMIAGAGVGIAVANACAEARAEANWITEAEGPRGVLEALERLINPSL